MHHLLPLRPYAIGIGFPSDFVRPLLATGTAPSDSVRFPTVRLTSPLREPPWPSVCSTSAIPAQSFPSGSESIRFVLGSAAARLPPIHSLPMGRHPVPISFLLSPLLPGGWPAPAAFSSPSYPRGDGMPVRGTDGDGADGFRLDDRAVEVVPSSAERSFDENVERLQPDERILFEDLGRGHTLRKIAAAQERSVVEIGRLHRRLLQRLNLDTPLALRRRAVRWCRETTPPIRGDSSSRAG